ncbi:hypothetical protein F5Y15DRAFT_414621 [Xylariaceae sp. FL0016]|nr:hypothetical protein F5Y15DRAFT_414621 [Xylariaceae sp. FL0016]
MPLSGKLALRSHKGKEVETLGTKADPIPPDIAHGGSRDMEMDDIPVDKSVTQDLSPDNAQDADEPNQITTGTPHLTLLGGTGPVTRSEAGKSHFENILTTTPTVTGFTTRLHNSGIGFSLQESPSILDFPDIDQDDEEDADDDHDGMGKNLETNQTLDGLELAQELADRRRSRPSRKDTKQQTSGRVVRRSARIESRATLGSTRSRKRIQKTYPAGSLRRSKRLAKPLTEFHKFPELPPELRLLIWEAAISPRLVYLTNRISSQHADAPIAIHNQRPKWFLASREALHIARSAYTKMFAANNHFAFGFHTPPQEFHANQDIVIYEPCHNGCRAQFCARQYQEQDRKGVRFLAVQQDSPYLIAGSESGWVTVSRAWENVETLYFMRIAVRGPDSQEKAMIRVRPCAHEAALHKLFQDWKKGAGKYSKLRKLEFVTIVNREASTNSRKNLYTTVMDRETGGPEDIIIG